MTTELKQKNNSILDGKLPGFYFAPASQVAPAYDHCQPAPGDFLFMKG